MHSDTPAANSVDRGWSGAASQTLRVDPLITFPISSDHRVLDFQCSNAQSEVATFFRDTAPILVRKLYCRVFILPNPHDATDVWGFYTLSAGILFKSSMSRSDEARALGIPAPVVRIGYMGRSKSAAVGLGRGLIIDAARRVYRNADIAAWGLVLESENGPSNRKLWDWYQKQGFKPCRLPKVEEERKISPHHPMYAPLSAFLPELQQKITD